ncbi:MAG: hypothetical protein GY793_07520 [Proteobacteria bacterium]|nr:hypothetical protein [Pseudomonadota bacterium]
MNPQNNHLLIKPIKEESVFETIDLKKDVQKGKVLAGEKWTGEVVLFKSLNQVDVEEGVLIPDEDILAII